MPRRTRSLLLITAGTLGSFRRGPSIAPFIGRKYQHDEVFCYLSTPWGEYEKILTGFTGRVVEVCAQQGANVHKGDVIGYILRSDIFA